MTPVAEVSEARQIVDEGQVRALLGTIPDPEIPNVSITELGMIGAIDVGAAGIRVELLPTFVGCPAVELIRLAISDRLAIVGLPVEVLVSFATPWTSDRISPVGREKLRRSGFAPPRPTNGARSLPVLGAAPPVAIDDQVACPFCGAASTTLESAFGPTLCRSIRHCGSCRQPFEAFKSI